MPLVVSEGDQPYINFLILAGEKSGNIVCINEESPFLTEFDNQLQYLYFFAKSILTSIITMWLPYEASTDFLGEFEIFLNYQSDFRKHRVPYNE